MIYADAEMNKPTTHTAPVQLVKRKQNHTKNSVSKPETTTKDSLLAEVLNAAYATPEVKTEATVPAQTEATVPAQTEAIETAQTEATVLAQTEATVLAQTEATVPAPTEATETAQTEATPVAQTEATTVAQTEATETVQTEATAPAQTEATEAAKTEATETAQTEATTEAETEATETAQTEATTEAETEKATEAEPEATTEAETIESITTNVTAVVVDAVQEVVESIQENTVDQVAKETTVDQVAQVETVEVPAQPVEANTYPIGQCTWGVKEVAPWVGNRWGNANMWPASAQAAGHSVGYTPQVGSVAVWTAGECGHVAYVTNVNPDGTIQVLEANYNGNQYIDNYRGVFTPTSDMVYIYQ